MSLCTPKIHLLTPSEESDVLLFYTYFHFCPTWLLSGVPTFLSKHRIWALVITLCNNFALGTFSPGNFVFRVKTECLSALYCFALTAICTHCRQMLDEEGARHFLVMVFQSALALQDFSMTLKCNRPGSPGQVYLNTILEDQWWISLRPYLDWLKLFSPGHWSGSENCINPMPGPDRHPTPSGYQGSDLSCKIQNRAYSANCPRGHIQWF